MAINNSKDVTRGCYSRKTEKYFNLVICPQSPKIATAFSMKICTAQSFNMSAIVRDSRVVSKEHLLETIYSESNGHMTDDVTWPPKGQGRDSKNLRSFVSL